MTDRSRIRRGREVSYNPTAAEVTALGAGPWPALITKVNADGTCDLAVDPPNASSVGAALADPLIASPAAAAQTGAYVQADVQSIATLANELRTDVIALAQRVNQLVTAAGRKASVRQGGQPGQFSLDAGPDAV